MEKNNEDYNQDNREPKPSVWGKFRFFGETSATPEAEENSAEIDAQPDTTKSFPLGMASVGERLLIVKLKGSEATVRRLIGMGLVPGCQLQIISSTGGSVIVGVGDNRIGLGIGMAQKIMCSNA